MPTLNIHQGESLRLAVQIDGVDISTLTNVEISINRISYTLDSEEITQAANVFTLTLSSNTTSNFKGKYPVYLAIDSTVLGVQKSDSLLTLDFTPAAPLSSPSTTTVVDAYITATIDTDTIIADATLAQIFKGDKGDKGDTGATGAQGPQGIQGIQGLKGDKGDTGAQGPQGIQGIQGVPGATGATGPQGPAGFISLNGLTASVQTYSTGTSGTDFNIASSGSNHTFNLPDASSTARGLISTGTQSIQGAKSFLADLNTRRLIATGTGTTSATYAFEARNSAGTALFTVQNDGTIQLSPNVGIVNLGNGQLQITAISNTATLTSAGNWRLLAGSAEVIAYGSAFGNLSLFGGFTPLGVNLGGTRVVCLASGTAPNTSVADHILFYSADIVAGNAAPHFRTENGKVIKLYCQDNTTAAATFASGGAGSNIKTDDTFDGYTIAQIARALRNAGFLN